VCVAVLLREGTGVKPSAQVDVPTSLHNWAAPEVVRRRKCTEKADLYSLCTIIQEMYTGSYTAKDMERASA